MYLNSFVKRSPGEDSLIKTEILYRGRGLIGFPTQDHLVTEPTVRNIMGHSTALKFGKNWLG